MLILTFLEEKTGTNENIEWVLITLAVLTFTVWVVGIVVRFLRRKMQKSS